MSAAFLNGMGGKFNIYLYSLLEDSYGA